MSPEEFQALLDDPRSHVSGGPINSFIKGWAIIPFIQKPHYWRAIDTGKFAAVYKGQRVSFFRSLCGVEQQSYPGAGLLPLAPGNVPKCKKCNQKAPA